jgi:hypothetical protein
MRGRHNWLVDAYTDATARPAPYRRPVMINNLFEPGQLSSPSESKDKLEEKDDFLDEPIPDEPEISGPKLYLLKLVEFNKVALLEKVGFGAKPSQ